jgi:DNA-binding response OmpR family regulator
LIKKRRILIVDDEPDLVSICKMVLEHEGFEVVAFTDSFLAFSNFKPNFYDLLILDIKMPDMDGFDLYKKIKELDNNVKICFLTASELYYQTFRNKEYSSIDNDLFIHKPIENEKLINKINKVISYK